MRGLRAELMARGDALRRFGLTPQRTGEYGIKTNLPPAEITAQKAGLRNTQVGEAVVVIRAECRLPVAYEINHQDNCSIRAIRLLHGKSNATLSPPPSRLAN